MIALGALLESREEIIQKPTKAEVSSFFARFKLLTEGQVEAVVGRAVALCEHAPLSLRKQLQGVVARYETSKAWIKLNIIGAPCLHVSILDVLRDKKDGRIIFFVDCRSAEELSQGMLPTAYPLPIDNLLGSTPTAFREAIQRIKALQDETPELHFCLYGRGGHSPKKAGNAELNAIVFKLMRESFKHVSLIQNGYLGIHNFALDGRVELTGHVRDSCPICLRHMSPLAKGFASVKGTLSKISHSRNIELIRARASNAISLIKQSIEESIQREEERMQLARVMETDKSQLSHTPQRPPKPQQQKEEKKKKQQMSSGLFTIDDDEEEEADGEKVEVIKQKKEEVTESTHVEVTEQNTSTTTSSSSIEATEKEKDKETSSVVTTTTIGGGDDDDSNVVDFGEDLEENEKEDSESKSTFTNNNTTLNNNNNNNEEEEEEDNEDEEVVVKVEEPEGYSTIQSWMTQGSLWEVTPEDRAGKWFVTVSDKEMTLLERHPKIFSYVRVAKSIPVKDIEGAAEDKAAHGVVVSLVGGAQEKLAMDDAQEFVKAVKLALENNTV